MITIKKTTNWKYIIEKNNITIKAMFEEWKIWLTKKDISDIYWSKKSNIKKELNTIIENSDINLNWKIKKIYNSKKDKNETYYSLDVLLILWYKSKHFKETKFLVNTNKIIKEYNISRNHRLSKFYSAPIVEKFINYLNPILKII
jgi:hypothetical protein